VEDERLTALGGERAIWRRSGHTAN
jgi:hypothetical protein